jgi:DNA-binding MarR family transcriptional regulator
VTGLKILQLLELSYRVNKKITRRLADHIYLREGLSDAEVQALFTLHSKQVCRVSELSSEIGIPPSTATGILDRLDAKGLLERVPDPDDRRGIILKSVPATSAMIERLSATLTQEMEPVLSVLPDGRMQGMIEDLKQILSYLEQEKQ